MERRRTSVRCARLVGVALLLAGGATACGSDGLVGSAGTAATVNGKTITIDQVQERVDAQADFVEASRKIAEKQRTDAIAQAAAQGGDPSSIPSAEELKAQIDEELTDYASVADGTLPQAGAAEMLTGLIVDEIDRSALRAAGGKVTDEQRATARSEVETDLTSSQLKVADLPKSLIDQAVESRALRAALAATAPDDVRNQPVMGDDEYTAQLQSIYAEQKDSFTQLCLDIIITPDVAAGEAAKARVVAGEDIADVAAEASTEGREAATDGAGGCVARADVAGVLGDEAMTAAAGDLLGPGEAQDGSVILVQVDRIEEPTFEDLRPQLEEANPNTATEEAAEAALDAYVNDLADQAEDAAEVEVNPRFGTWVPRIPASGTSEGAPARVEPPADPDAIPLRTSDDESVPPTEPVATGGP